MCRNRMTVSASLGPVSPFPLLKRRLWQKQWDRLQPSIMRKKPQRRFQVGSQSLCSFYGTDASLSPCHDDISIVYPSLFKLRILFPLFPGDIFILAWKTCPLVVAQPVVSIDILERRALPCFYCSPQNLSSQVLGLMRSLISADRTAQNTSPERICDLFSGGWEVLSVLFLCARCLEGSRSAVQQRLQSSRFPTPVWDVYLFFICRQILQPDPSDPNGRQWHQHPSCWWTTNSVVGCSEHCGIGHLHPLHILHKVGIHIHLETKLI